MKLNKNKSKKFSNNNKKMSNGIHLAIKTMLLIYFQQQLNINNIKINAHQK